MLDSLGLYRAIEVQPINYMDLRAIVVAPALIHADYKFPVI